MSPFPASAPPAPLKPVAYWLFACSAMILLMVIIGGLTRLTGSGLSMVEWAPVVGWIPPINEADWQNLFAQYRQSPEFLKINWEMDLEGFKSIFWLEFIHRVVGRLTGVVFLLPFLYFLGKRRIDRALAWQFVLMFLIGGLQGGMGWYMVKSGLVDNPHVSQYRLTAHLGIAVFLYAYMLWVALGLYFGQRQRSSNLPKHPLLGRTMALTALIFLTLLSGGFVAGLDAGMAFNTFPLMNDEWIPEGIFFLQPAYLNFFENIATVQWNHRLLATVVFLSVSAYWWTTRRYALSKPVAMARQLLLLMVVIQVTLGIATLLLMVPTPLASAHQTGAVLLLTLSLFLTHRLYHAAS